MDGIGVARRFTDLGKKLHALVYNPDAAGEFAWEVTIGLLAYAANRVGEIADDIVQIDQAMRWGFGWEMGPFETWDAIGVEKSVRRMKHERQAGSRLREELLASGSHFLLRPRRRWRSTVLRSRSNALQPDASEPGVIVLADEKAAGSELLRNWSASLIDLG